MKIYIDDRQIKNLNFKKITDKLTTINFTNKLEESYDADAIVVFPDFVTEENLNKYSNLKWIQLFTAGFNTIDLDFVKSRDIYLTNAKGVYSKTIAEDVVTKILAINRNVRKYFENMKLGLWQPQKSEYELTGATVGIIGTGSIGGEIAKRLKAFETKIIGHRRKKEDEPYFDEIYIGEDGLNKLIKESDYLILALPLNESSYHLIDESKFKLMKKNVVLVNIARGEVINQDALIKALENKTIRGAALDVTVPEPLPKDNKLWQMENVLITPHNAVSSPYLIDRLVSFIIENIENYVYNNNVINHVRK